MNIAQNISETIIYCDPKNIDTPSVQNISGMNLYLNPNDQNKRLDNIKDELSFLPSVIFNIIMSYEYYLYITRYIKFQKHKERITQILNLNNNKIVTGSGKDGKIIIWNNKSGKIIYELNPNVRDRNYLSGYILKYIKLLPNGINLEKIMACYDADIIICK